MAIEIPVTDAEFCTSWSPQERDAFTRLPLTLERHERKMRDPFGSWKQLFDTFDWKPNQGEEQKLIIPEPSPIVRQHGYGVAICDTRTIDKPNVSERLAPKLIYTKEFQAGPFHWCDSYKDFIKNRLGAFFKALVRDQEIFNNLFLRSWIYHQSPYFLVADSVGALGIPVGGFVDGAPTGIGQADGSTGKVDDWLEMAASSLGTPGIMSHELLTTALNIMDTDLGAEPYRSGSIEQDSALNDKYMWMASPESYSTMVDDPYVRENRIENEDIIRKGFRGPLCGGRVLASLHSNPLRFYISEITGKVVWPSPQIRVETPTAPNFGQVVVNPTYARAPYEINFLCGAKGYGTVSTGAPPDEFRREGMSWNGQPKLITDFLIPCPIEGNPGNKEFNFRKEWLLWDSIATFGAVTIDSRQVLPILFKRSRGNRMILR